MLDKIETLELGILIVNLIFNIVKVVLIIISVLIIFSLLLSSVESKSFELAVVRMVGFEKEGVIALIVCQSFLYVIPAIICAFASSTIILYHASQWSYKEYKISIDWQP